MLALSIGTLPAAYALPPDKTRSDVELVDLPDAVKVPGKDGGGLAEMTTPAVTAPEEYEPTKTQAPPGATATETVTGLTPGETVPVGTLPVEVGAPAEATAEQAAALEGSWQVALADQAELAGTGIDGIVFTVTPPSGATGDAVVSLDYTQFAELYGASWADRLQFVQYPSCFLTTPDVEACSVPREVDTENVVATKPDDVAGDGVIDGERRIEAVLDVAALADPGAATTTASRAGTSEAGTTTPAVFTGSTQQAVAAPTVARAAAESGSSVLVASSSGSGAKGDFSANPLPTAGSWSAGTSSGAFSYSYAMQAPAVPGGPTPSLGLTYNSQTVDGRTSATNNQASWIGDGWDYNAGSISRTYRACRDDRTDGNNKNHKTGDLCWGSYNATLTLGGTTTELVLPDGADAHSNKWVTANGDGSLVELLKDTENGRGDKDGEYWRVTTRDGTQYHFGMHKLPGWSDNGADADDPVTNSVLQVPVAGNQPGEPCYQTAFANSFCDQAWRWNLDYVVDPNDNAMSLWWKKETNYFARNLKFKDPVLYDRGGYLTRIDYGQRKSTLFDAAPLARVTFAVDERCFVEDGIQCTDANFASGEFAKTRIWYDTPADLHCTKDKDCYVPTPTFWSRLRLGVITTSAQRIEGSTQLQTVDTWTLAQSLPSERTDEGTALWLESITRRGFSPSGETIGLRPVTFVANTTSMPNRVREGSKDPRPTFDRLRIERVVNEYGGETYVDYSEPAGACRTGSDFPETSRNTERCFPAYWHPDPDKADESVDWFNKYVVDHIQELPAVKGVPGTTTTYEYGEAGDAAWALNQAEFSQKKTRTYDQWRGYGLVRTITGADSTDALQGTKRSVSVTRYFRGMDNDPLPGTTHRDITVLDFEGDAIAKDHLALQGRVAESRTYDGYNGNLVSRSVDYPAVTVLATRTRADGIPDLHAYRVQDTRSITKTRSSGTRPGDARDWRTVETKSTYDTTYGLPATVESLGDTGRSGDESCSVMSYVHNPGAHLIGLPKQTLTTAGTCAEAANATADEWISGSRAAYDNNAYGVEPTTGLATATWNISPTGGSWTLSGTVAYDTYGRPTSATDAGGNTSQTTYTPATGQVHKITSLNALNHSETVVIEPGRGTTLRETDPNGATTVYTFDALGRATNGWRAGQTVNDPPVVKFTYNTTPGEPVSIVTSTRDDQGRYSDSVVFYDGLGRERQRQQPAVGAGRLITDTLYSANGTIERTNNAYHAAGTPQPVMFEPDSDLNIPNSTLYKYDGAGRLLSETPQESGTANQEKATRYEYGFDYSTVINPTGAASQRTWNDALGRVARIDTYTDANRTGTPRSTTYEYDRFGNQVKAVDAKGNTWSWTYDARGRQTSATDPDTGTTTTSYDVLDRPLVTTADRNGTAKVAVWNGYDKLSRPTEQRLGSATGTLLASSTYDTVPGGIGLPASSTRYENNLAYTSSVTGYTKEYQPTGTKLTLPQSVATLYGLASSYQYSYEYTETGLLKSTSLPAAGSFAAEKILTRYNNDGLPVSTSGRDWYTAETTYSVYGEVLRTVSGEHPNRVWTSHLYDERTGELERSIVDRESTENPATDSRRVNQRSYAYDPAGNVKKIEDTAGSVTDRQCFAYDVIGQLTRAWTSDQSECAVTADGSPTAVTLGAGDGYHKKYTYDELGNRTEQVDHALKLVDHDANPQTPDVTNADSANDATTTYSYGGTGGKQPHTLTGMTTQYTTDAGARVTKSSTRAYDDAGNMTSRVDGGDEQALSWTWDGKVQKVTGFGDNGSGAWLGSGGMCLDLAAASTTAGTAMQLHTCNGSRAQKLRIDAASATDSSKGALKVLDRCVVPKDGATSDGTAVVIAECTGTGTDAQQWAASTTGNKLKHVSSGKCLAAPGASPASGTKLVLAPCDTDGAQQSWKPANETTYVYGPGGERLMSLTASERVLHLGDTTVSISTSGGVSYTERYYTQPGAPAVMRHSTGTDSTGELSMQVSDQTGTAYVNVKLGAGNTVKFNKLDPFGVKRSENASWRSNRGFVGGHDDTATGLVHLGAREYDPSTGRFISADPVLDLADPVQKNGYIYCENNPVTFADPTGLASDGSGVPDNYYAGTEGSEAWANQQLNMSLGDIILSVGWAVLKEFVGWDAVVGCFSRGDLWACGSLFIEAVPAIKMFKAVGAVIKAVNRIASAIDAWHKAKEKARKIIAAAKAAREAARKAAEEAKAAAKKAAQLAAKRAQEAATRAAKTAAKKTGNAAQKTSKSAATKSQSGAGKKSAGAQPKRTNAPKDAESSGGGSCSVADNSFTPDTLVLMADGTTKRIEDVKNGDQVLATDPETGETRAETVTAEITGQGTKNLVDVTIDTDGNAGTVVSTLTATDGHPFWVPELGEWLDAEDLQQGQWLRTSAGTFVQITAVHHRTASDARVHNLTISDLHTYYVLAGTASVLAHNTNSEACPIAFAVDSAGEATALPVHEIDSVAHAPQAANFQRAVASGAPAIVTRGAGGEAAARRTRRQAQAHAPRPRRFASNATWEEYPFASTVEGGRGATLTLSPGSINSSHGNALKRFYSDSGIGVGDQFIVRILP